MSSLRLELRQNLETGRHDLFVKLDSDRDLTSQEHEALHRSLVEKLLGQGLLKIEQLGDLNVERAPVGVKDRSPSPQPAELGARGDDGPRMPNRLAH